MDDDALTWAGALALRIPEIARPDLAEAWNGEAGKRRREELKAAHPEILSQLAGHVRDRELATREG